MAAWNLDHIARHGVKPAEAEYVVEHAQPPYPQYMGDDRILVRGQTKVGRYLQVIYVLECDVLNIDYAELDLSQLDPDMEAFYVVHARPLTRRERHSFNRGKPE